MKCDGKMWEEKVFDYIQVMRQQNLLLSFSVRGGEWFRWTLICAIIIHLI
jgi:hypothetical protein